jgi:hypothetical protein
MMMMMTVLLMKKSSKNASDITDGKEAEAFE